VRQVDVQGSVWVSAASCFPADWLHVDRTWGAVLWATVDCTIRRALRHTLRTHRD
jgi:hypothetical protein